MDSSDTKRFFLALGVIQTFFVILMSAMVILQSAAWVLLGCILLFSLIDLGCLLVVGNVVARTADAVRRLAVQLERVDQRTKRPRPDGLLDVGGYQGGRFEARIEMPSNS